MVVVPVPALMAPEPAKLAEMVLVPDAEMLVALSVPLPAMVPPVTVIAGTVLAALALRVPPLFTVMVEPEIEAPEPRVTVPPLAVTPPVTTAVLSISTVAPLVALRPPALTVRGPLKRSLPPDPAVTAEAELSVFAMVAVPVPVMLTLEAVMLPPESATVDPEALLKVKDPGDTPPASTVTVAAFVKLTLSLL